MALHVPRVRSGVDWRGRVSEAQSGFRLRVGRWRSRITGITSSDDTDRRRVLDQGNGVPSASGNDMCGAGRVTTRSALLDTSGRSPRPCRKRRLWCSPRLDLSDGRGCWADLSWKPVPSQTNYERFPALSRGSTVPGHDRGPSHWSRFNLRDCAGFFSFYTAETRCTVLVWTVHC